MACSRIGSVGHQCLSLRVGVFDAAVLVALRLSDVDDSRALSYAVVLHALSFFPY
jgi:hypothetical protein